MRSTPRAIAAARFFRPILGQEAVLVRMRVINRLFELKEVSRGLAYLDKVLDQNVTVIDPRVTEREMAKWL